MRYKHNSIPPPTGGIQRNKNIQNLDRGDLQSRDDISVLRVFYKMCLEVYFLRIFL